MKSGCIGLIASQIFHLLPTSDDVGEGLHSSELENSARSAGWNRNERECVRGSIMISTVELDRAMGEKKTQENKLDVAEMRMLRWMCEVAIIYRKRNETNRCGK